MNIKSRNITVIIIALTIAAVAIIITAGFVIKQKRDEPSSWILQSYGNSVALYNDDQLDTVFEGIVLDTLPEEDVRLLENGIVFPSKEEALGAIEDYDG